MDNLPVSPHAGGSDSRSASPARPRGFTTNTASVSAVRQQQQSSQSVPSVRHNVTATSSSSSSGKKSEPLIRGRRRSPVPLRKGQPVGGAEVSVSTPNSAAGGLQSSGWTPTGSSAAGSTSSSGTLPHSRPVQQQQHTGSQEEAGAPSGTSGLTVDDSDLMPSLDCTANLSNGSSSEYLAGAVPDDYADSGSGTPDLHRTRVAIDRFHHKIVHTKEMISQEQKARDDNVNEYLKLASNADKQQLQRIKNVFEKKNQKSAQLILQLQKKLENYDKRIKELELYGFSSHHRQPKEVLRDVSQGLKSVMSKPREFAHLIKNKFGSADNINTMTTTKIGDESGSAEEGTDKNHHHNSATFPHNTKYTSDDECSSVTSGSGPTAGTGTMSSPRNVPHPATAATAATLSGTPGGVTMPTGLMGGGGGMGAGGAGTGATMVSTATLSSSLPGAGMTLPIVSMTYVTLDSFLQEVQERREEHQRFQEDVDTLKTQINQEIAYYNQSLLEERYRYERLEEQLNDLIELHQNEVENLKQGISDMEEKLQYQSEERLRDIHEMMESNQTRISKIEHQLHEQQQLVNLDSIENSNARALVLKLINVVLTVLQVVLLLVATASNILMPFIKTRVRILTTTVLIIAVLIAIRQWHDSIGYLRDFVYHVKGKFSSSN